MVAENLLHRCDALNKTEQDEWSVNDMACVSASGKMSLDQISKHEVGCLEILAHSQCARPVTCEQEHPALTFVRQNRRQIQNKAFKFGVEMDDVCQSICLIYLERISNFDSSRNSLRGYIFGHLEQVLRRETIGALRFAISIDDDGASGATVRNQVDVAVNTESNEVSKRGVRVQVPGHASLKEIAELVSGKSSRELATARGVTKRRLNQILKKVRDDATVQFDFEFVTDPT